METENVDQEILLVKEPQSEELKVVSGVDANGNLKSVPPKKEHSADFMRIDKNSNILESFFSNFMRQVKDPSHFGFFKVPEESVEVTSDMLSREMARKDDPASQAFVNNTRVNPSDYVSGEEQAQATTQTQPTTQAQSGDYKALDGDRVDWAQFEKIGVTRASLEKSGALEAMLNYRKTPSLVPITIKVDDIAIRTEARLSLREAEDGRLIPMVYAIQKAPQLDRPFYGNTFTAEDKKALAETGNLGRVVELKIPNQSKPVKALVSIDKLTNDIVATNIEKVRIANEIKGVPLTPEQKQSLLEGKAVYIEGMTAKSGKSFNATLQFNADKRGLEFQFGDAPKQAQQQGQQVQSAPRELRIPNKLLGREVSAEESAQLKGGEVVYMTGLKDQKGESFNAYVRANFERGKFDFMKWNPNKSKEITPDNASKTQVAVNSEGKTNEATKNINEPMKQQQTEPTEQQQQRSRGMKR